MKNKIKFNCDAFKIVANWLRKSNTILKLYISFLVLRNVIDKFNRRLTISNYVKRHQLKNLIYYNVIFLILNPLCPSLFPQNSTLFQLCFWAIMLVIIVFYLNCRFIFYCLKCSIKCLDLILFNCFESFYLFCSSITFKDIFIERFIYYNVKFNWNAF